jgi:hypothetical protein
MQLLYFQKPCADSLGVFLEKSNGHEKWSIKLQEQVSHWWVMAFSVIKDFKISLKLKPGLWYKGKMTQFDLICCCIISVLEISLRYWGVTEIWHYSEVNRQGKIYLCRRVHTSTSGRYAHQAGSPKGFYLILFCPWIWQVWGSQSTQLAS